MDTVMGAKKTARAEEWEDLEDGMISDADVTEGGEGES